MPKPQTAARATLIAGLLALTFASAPAARAASGDDFQWQGQLAAGKTVEIKGINGSIEARLAPGSETVITARKRGRASETSQVRIERVEHEGGVTVCAIYPSRDSHRPNECRAGDGHNSNSNNQTEVEFEVLVPRGVNFVGRTVNGGIEAVDLPGDAFAYTVNGGVKVTAAGEARAETVNGSIRAAMGRADGHGPLSFKTVNGGITVELPASVEADVHAETVNGGIETDFPLTVKGKWVGRRIDGRIGAGGRKLELETVNGSITLRKSS